MKEQREKVMVWLLLATLLGQLVTSAAGERDNILTVLGLHTESPPWVRYTWLQMELDLPNSTTHLTFCFHLQLNIVYSSPGMVMTLGTQTGVFVRGGRYGVMQGNTFLIPEEPLSPWQWRHLCVVLGPSPAVVVDGVTITPDDEGPPFPLTEEPMNLTLGMPKAYFGDSLITSFGGTFTTPTVFPRKLQEAEMQSLAECRGNLAGDLGVGVWRVLTSGWEEAGAVYHNHTDTLYTDILLQGHLQVRQVAAWEVCLPRASHRYVILDVALNHRDAHRYCAALGGDLPWVKKDLDLMNIINLTVLEKTSLMMVVWGQDEDMQCPLIIHSASRDKPDVAEARCLTLSGQLICKVPTNITFTLRHNGVNQDDETFYLTFHKDKHPRFLSLAGRRLVTSGTEFLTLTLQDSEGVPLATAVTRTTYPMGRFLWSDAVTNTTKTMVLTKCSLVV